MSFWYRWHLQLNVGTQEIRWGKIYLCFDYSPLPHPAASLQQKKGTTNTGHLRTDNTAPVQRAHTHTQTHTLKHTYILCRAWIMIKLLPLCPVGYGQSFPIWSPPIILVCSFHYCKPTANGWMDSAGIVVPHLENTWLKIISAGASNI